MMKSISVAAALLASLVSSAVAQPPQIQITPQFLMDYERQLFGMVVTGDLSGLDDFRRRVQDVQSRMGGEKTCQSVMFDIANLALALTEQPAERVAWWKGATYNFMEGMEVCERATNAPFSKRLLPRDLLVTLLPEWREQAVRDMLAADQAAAKKLVQ